MGAPAKVLSLELTTFAAIATWIQAAAATAAAVIAGMAAFYVRRQWQTQPQQIEAAREAELQLQEERARPFVVVDLVPGETHGSIHLVIENVGATLARNVRMKFEPPLVSAWDHTGDTAFADPVLMREGIPSLPPGRRIETVFDFAPERIRQELPTTFRVTAAAEDYQGRPQAPLEYILDLAYQYELVRVSRKGLHEIAESLKRMEGVIEKWGESSGGGLRVWSRDGDAEVKRMAAIHMAKSQEESQVRTGSEGGL